MAHIKILPYSPELQSYFESINRNWITDSIGLDDSDLAQLQQPEKNIIANGGHVLFAAMDENIIGTAGLLKKTDCDFELVKMAVLPEFRGLGVGLKLINEIIEKAKESGAKRIQLSTNQKLLPAISLYKKLGFKQVALGCGQDRRCDIKMELAL